MGGPIGEHSARTALSKADSEAGRLGCDEGEGEAWKRGRGYHSPGRLLPCRALLEDLVKPVGRLCIFSSVMT
jgi:hypothetical protein